MAKPKSKSKSWRYNDWRNLFKKGERMIDWNPEQIMETNRREAGMSDADSKEGKAAPAPTNGKALAEYVVPELADMLADEKYRKGVIAKLQSGSISGEDLERLQQACEYIAEKTGVIFGPETKLQDFLQNIAQPTKGGDAMSDTEDTTEAEAEDTTEAEAEDTTETEDGAASLTGSMINTDKETSSAESALTAPLAQKGQAKPADASASTTSVLPEQAVPDTVALICAAAKGKDEAAQAAIAAASGIFLTTATPAVEEFLVPLRRVITLSSEGVDAHVELKHLRFSMPDLSGLKSENWAIQLLIDNVDLISPLVRAAVEQKLGAGKEASVVHWSGYIDRLDALSDAVGGVADVTTGKGNANTNLGKLIDAKPEDPIDNLLADLLSSITVTTEGDEPSTTKEED